jgi:hypothetical protein
MAEFTPWAMEGTSILTQVRNWRALQRAPYDKDVADAYTRARVLLMGGMEYVSVTAAHELARTVDKEDIQHALALIRRVDAQHRLLVRGLHPANQTPAETLVACEQMEVDLAANLALSEEYELFRQALELILLEDFDHLFRAGCLLELLHNLDPNTITQGNTEIKPGIPTAVAHRHPFDVLSRPYDKDTASLGTKLHYWIMVAAQAQAGLYYQSCVNVYREDVARALCMEIADVEEEHLSLCETLGDPRETPLEKMALLQLAEAFAYYSCAATEVDETFRLLWEELCREEIAHANIIGELMERYEQRTLPNVLRAERVEPLIVFEPNKAYINNLLESWSGCQPHAGIFLAANELPEDWLSFSYRETLNAGGAPSREVAEMAEDEGKLPKAA